MNEMPAGAGVQTLGREVVRGLQVSLRTVRSHGWSNEASTNAIRSIAKAVNDLLAAHGEFGLHTTSDFVFINDTRLKVDAAGHGIFDALIHELTSRGVGNVYFGGELDRGAVETLLEVLLGVTEEEAAGDPVDLIHRLNDALGEAGSPITLGPVKEPDASGADDEGDRKERAKKAFFKAVTVARALFTSAHLNKRLDLRHAKRVVQNMVDLMLEEEFSLLGLTTLKDYDNYTFYHSVNVCIYSLALGKRLGFTRTQLSELGVAALLHDMGKTKVPLAILRKRGIFTPDELDVMKRHPEMGVRELVKMKGLSSLAFKAMIAAFEHHLNYNPKLPGYPRVRHPVKPHVIGRIVAIADCFDAMTTKRCYTPKAQTRDKALAFMLSQGGQKFDPHIVKIFANLIGVFPVGTLVKLKSGRLAVVTAPAEDPTLCHRPRVRPVTNRQGIEVDQSEIDLSLPGPGGQVPDEILTAVDEESVGFDTAKYFL
jgi:HD-GYP domain-containing protein (c-di-GMP phosphodiesterase class II)